MAAMYSSRALKNWLSICRRRSLAMDHHCTAYSAGPLPVGVFPGIGASRGGSQSSDSAAHILKYSLLELSAVRASVTIPVQLNHGTLIRSNFTGELSKVADVVYAPWKLVEITVLDSLQRSDA